MKKANYEKASKIHYIICSTLVVLFITSWVLHRLVLVVILQLNFLLLKTLPICEKERKVEFLLCRTWPPCLSFSWIQLISFNFSFFCYQLCFLVNLGHIFCTIWTTNERVMAQLVKKGFLASWQHDLKLYSPFSSRFNSNLMKLVKHRIVVISLSFATV
jgi:hypothetical protein